MDKAWGLSRNELITGNGKPHLGIWAMSPNKGWEGQLNPAQLPSIQMLYPEAN